tara:strand:+ start:85 stop:324 length:240 start_codon:yes stop_codon:yes gene_type:complete
MSMRKKRNHFKKEPHFFLKEPEYLLQYLELIKNEKYWRNSGQYHMAKECERRAKCLLNKDMIGFLSVEHSEHLLYPIKK